MNKMIWRTAIVGGVMAVGLFSVPGSLSMNTWVAGPMISDPMDLNHLEAKEQHARWAAQVKAAREEAERRQAELVAESERAAAAAREAARTNPGTPPPPKANTTPPRKPAPVPQPPRDEWMETYNYWSARLPGIWSRTRVRGVQQCPTPGRSSSRGALRCTHSSRSCCTRQVT